MAILYIIGTPIGNLGDITYRAVEALKSLDILACEDTRRTLKLLTHLSIRVKLVSCRSGNEERAAKQVIAALDAGNAAGYVSDAGTPAISDPGSILVRLAAEGGHQVLPIPGPSAFATLASVSGGLDRAVHFEGFLSPKQGRRRSRLLELLSMETAFILFESPFRILKLLDDLVEIDKERYICIGREMTKIHEEYLRGSAEQIRAQLANRERQIGEFAVYVSGKKMH